MITFEAFWMGRDKTHSVDLTEEVKKNAKEFVPKVNAFLAELGWAQECKVSSGWRPASINGAVGGAKRSLHMLGLAVDIRDDKDQTLGKLVASKPELMRKYGLFLEDLGATKGKHSNWVHLDASPTRSDRPSRIFKP